MKNQKLETQRANVREVVAKGYRIARVSFIVVMVGLSLVGGYVVANADLRNQTIDFAQGDYPKAQ